jgi:hypothetical protein
VTVAFAARVVDEVRKLEGRLRFGVTSQHNRVREFALPSYCMDGSSCRWRRSILTCRCAIVLVKMVRLAIQLIRHLGELVHSNIAKVLDFKSTVIHLCDTWLLRKNFLTELDNDSSREAREILPWCFWVEHVMDIG